MVLDGMITITHENHYTKTLNKFDTDAFEGDWKTSAVGRCTDFNLMIRGKYEGSLSHLLIDKGDEKIYSIPKNTTFLFFYLYKGILNFNINLQNIFLEDGQLIKIEHPKYDSILLKPIKNCALVIVWF